MLVTTSLYYIDIYTSEGELADPFDKYKLPHVNSDKIVNSWNSDPLKFYQNQFNFVTWCSTAGCGVSDEHLTHSNPMIRIYYQIRRLLKEASCPTSFQNLWNAFENNKDIAAYKKMCRDFHVSPVSNWRQKVDIYSRELGIAYYYDDGYIPVPGKDYDNSSLHVPYSSDNDYSDATRMRFGLNIFWTSLVVLPI